MKLFQSLFKIECPGARPQDPSRQLTRAEVYTEIARLMTLNQDMDGQIRELIARKELTPAQWADYERVIQEHREMAQGQAGVIAYLREQYPGDFRAVAGVHQGKGFWDILMGYLKGGK